MTDDVLPAFSTPEKESQRERERGGEERGGGGGQVVTSAHVGLGDMVRAVSALC